MGTFLMSPHGDIIKVARQCEGTPPYSVRGWPQCGKTVGRNSDLYENRRAFSARPVVRTWSQTEVPPTLIPIKHLVTESSTVAQLLFALVMTYPAGCVAFGGDSKRSNLGGCDGKSESGSEESCNNEEAQRNG